MDTSLKEERVIMSMAPLIEGVETDEDSIGYSLYYYKNNMIDKRTRQPNVKLISVDGIEPKNSPSFQVKEWLTSEEGQKVIIKAGYISIR